MFSLKTQKTFNLQGFSKTYCEFIFLAFFKCMKKRQRYLQCSMFYHYSLLIIRGKSDLGNDVYVLKSSLDMSLRHASSLLHPASVVTTVSIPQPFSWYAVKTFYVQFDMIMLSELLKDHKPLCRLMPFCNLCVWKCGNFAITFLICQDGIVL